MLRTLVAIYKEGGSERKKKRDTFKEGDAMSQTRIVDDVLAFIDTLAFIRPLRDVRQLKSRIVPNCTRYASMVGLRVMIRGMEHGLS